MNDSGIWSPDPPGIQWMGRQYSMYFSFACHWGESDWPWACYLPASASLRVGFCTAIPSCWLSEISCFLLCHRFQLFCCLWKGCFRSHMLSHCRRDPGENPRWGRHHLRSKCVTLYFIRDASYKILSTKVFCSFFFLITKCSLFIWENDLHMNRNLKIPSRARLSISSSKNPFSQS